jgi:thioredoxin 1
MANNTVTGTDANWEEQVLHSEQPVLVDFWAPWCGPCRQIGPSLEELAGEYAGRAKVVKVNVDENPEVAGRYNVRSIPTLLVFVKGQVVEQQTGAAPKPVIAKLLDAQLTAAAPVSPA